MQGRLLEPAISIPSWPVELFMALTLNGIGPAFMILALFFDKAVLNQKAMVQSSPMGVT